MNEQNDNHAKTHSHTLRRHFCQLSVFILGRVGEHVWSQGWCLFVKVLQG